MISYIGNFSLWLSLVFSFLQFLNSNRKNNFLVVKYNKIFVLGLLITTVVAFFSLMMGHIISDFGLVNVFQNSHTTKPVLYKISGVWGNHEGSMLLWILVLTIFNYFIFKIYNKKNVNFISKALETQSLITFGFLLFTILTSNPFQRMLSTEVEGLGFNPILQDPALAVHPPLLYIGYVGFSAAFSLSIAALSFENTNNQKFLWHIYMKPFVMTAWSFLTIGIGFGSLWAYYELGWGGWWFWDPVENASLMPWLLGTALLHSLITVDKKKSLYSWVLLLAILSFLLSVIGTFLVRSGILTSVHTFALDPSRGIYILSFTAILGLYSLTLYGLNSKKFSNNNYFSYFTKEGSILINNIIMVVVCSTVFLGTIYPLLVEAFTNNKISVGEPYFNSTVIPIMIPAILIMGIGPLLSWGRIDKLKTFKEIFPSILLTIIITTVFFLFYKKYSFNGIVGIGLAFWIISNNIIILFKKIKKQSKGMIIAHLGVGFLILGITGSSVWQEEKILNMKIKDSVKIKKYNIVFNKIEEIKDSNYLAIQGEFNIFKENEFIANLNPENRYYPITNNFTTEASIHTNIYRDLYIVLGDGNLKSGWVVRIYHNPLVIWIWFGIIVIFVGGVTTINNNLMLLKRNNQ